MRLVERLVDEKASIFVGKANDYRAIHRKGTKRPLSAGEAAQLAAAMADHLEGIAADPGGVAASIQKSGLRAYDEPEAKEVLLAAGAATAPEALDAALRLTALIEMDRPVFEDAREAGALDDAIEAAADVLRKGDMVPARARAAAAWAHFSETIGAGGPGEAWALISRIVAEGMRLAMSASPSRSSTSSLVDTDTGGDDETFSTTSPTGTPSS